MKKKVRRLYLQENVYLLQNIQQFLCKVIKNEKHRVTTRKDANTERSSMICLTGPLMLKIHRVNFFYKIM